MWTQTKSIFLIVFTARDSDEEFRLETGYNPEYFPALLVYVNTIGPLNKVKAIKFVRDELKCGLREAKYFVEYLLREQEVTEERRKIDTPVYEDDDAAD